MSYRNHTKELGIDSDIFQVLRKHFDAVLQRTFANMDAKKCDSADITVKLSVDIATYEDLYREKDGSTQRTLVKKPTFSHKVTSSMKVKDTEEGCFNEDYELVNNGVEFVLVPIMNGQTALDFGEEDDE